MSWLSALTTAVTRPEMIMLAMAYGLGMIALGLALVWRDRAL
ncbi:hypothetical protein [Aurantimonas sp. 22II-16-19i]|nr:hypothetical protein [Aurantimonas sp. 22II-16-19i]